MAEPIHSDYASSEAFQSTSRSPEERARDDESIVSDSKSTQINDSEELLASIADAEHKLRSAAIRFVKFSGNRSSAEARNLSAEIKVLKEKIATGKDVLALLELKQSSTGEVSHSQESIPPMSAPLVPKPARFKFPKFRIFKPGHDPITFLDDMEPLLAASGYRPHEYPAAMVYYSSTLARRWVNRNILKPKLDYLQAKKVFIKHYEGFEANGKRLDHLMDLHQRNEDVATFAEKYVLAAEDAAVDVNTPRELRAFRKKLHVDVQRQLQLQHDNPKSFDELLRYALRIEAALQTTTSHRRERSPQRPLRPPKWNRRGKPSTDDRNKGKQKVKNGCKHHGPEAKHTTAECRVLSSERAKIIAADEKTPSRSERYAHLTCHKCRKKGHIAPHCPELKKTQDKTKFKENRRIRQIPAGDEVEDSNSNRFRNLSEETASDSEGQRQYMGDPGRSHELSSSSDDDSGTDRIRAFSGQHKPNALKPREANKLSDELLVPCRINNVKVMALIDSGADISIIDKEVAKRLKLKSSPSKGYISGFSDTDTKTPKIGHCHVTLSFGNRHLLQVKLELWPSVNGCDLIIGRDLFKALGIGITGLPAAYPRKHDASEAPPKSLQPASSRKLSQSRSDHYDLADNSPPWKDEHRANEETTERIMHAIQPELQENIAISPASLCSHPKAIVSFNISPKAKPIFRAQYPVPRAVEQVVTDKVNQWLKAGVIEPTPHDNPWNSPLLVARKRDAQGNWTKHRVCIDPRHINQLMPRHSSSIPRIRELLRRLERFVIASALDLWESYHQFAVHPRDRKYMAFTWRRKRFHFVAAAFGFKPMTHIYQNVMEEILAEHAAYVAIYVDDIIIFSKSVEEHIKHLKAVIKTLNKWNLRLRETKCQFAYHRIRILGYIISGTSKVPDPRKLSTMLSWPVPTSGKQVQALLGFTNFLRDHIPLYARVAAPLESLRHLKNKEKFIKTWNSHPKYAQALATFKHILSRPPVLQFPQDNVPYVVATDASLYGIGAVLYQVIQDRKCYITFISKSLNDAQRNYSATKRELLAIVFALLRLHDYLYLKHFKLLTDHKALTFMLTQRHANRMLRDWLDVINTYDFTIVHCPGVLNVLPDALSRCYPALPEEPTIQDNRVRVLRSSEAKRAPKSRVTFSEIAVPLRVRNFTANKHSIANLPEAKLTSLIRDRFDKQLPSPDERKQLLQSFHCNGHFGPEQLFHRLWQAGYYWPTMRKECFTIVKTCLECLRFNIAKEGFHPYRPVHASLPFDHIAVDTFFMTHTSPRGHNLVLVYVCVATRFVILKPLKSKSMKDMVRCLWNIFCFVGFPRIIQSDNGTEFSNQLVNELTNLIGIDHRFVAAYNPRANGLAERHVGLAKKLLFKLATGNIVDFDLFLPSVQLALNTRIHKQTKTSPMVHALLRPFNPPLDYSSDNSVTLPPDVLTERFRSAHSILFPALAAAATSYQEKGATRIDSKRRKGGQHRHVTLPIGARVMLRDHKRSHKYEPRFVGPYKVVQVTRAKTYKLLDTNGELLQRNVPISQLKIIDLPDNKFNAPAPVTASPDSKTSGHALDQPTYTVEKVLKYRRRRGVDQYLVKWLNYPDSDNSWEPASNFEDTNLITDFWMRHYASHEPP